MSIWTPDWYKQLQRNNQAALFVPSNTASAANTISLIRTVKNIDKRQVVGYEILDISLDFIFESLKDISMSQYSGIFLESPKQELLFSTNEALTPVLSSLLGADNGIKQPERGYDLYSYRDKNFGFTFYYLSSRYDLYRNLRFATGLVLLFYFGMVVMAAFIFGRTSRQLKQLPSALSWIPWINIMQVIPISNVTSPNAVFQKLRRLR